MDYKDIVLPTYDHSILSTITSILKYYKVESNHKSLDSLDKILNEKEYENVILLVLDGMGEALLNDISKDGYFKQNEVDSITSVYPSTTTAAMTTYYSGNTPYETGWIAWSQYFKEYGRALDVFLHNDSYTHDPLTKPIINVYDNVMKFKSAYEKIEEANKDVRAFEIQPEYAQRNGKRKYVANNIDELVLCTKDICQIPGKKYIMAYCDNPDGLLHKFGTDSEEVKSYVLDAQEKIKKLKEELPENTIIIVSADHGHKNIDKAYKITDYPELWECFLMPPVLESRVVGFYIKPDMKEEFVKRFNKLFSEEFWLMDREEFLNKRKFLGTGTKHPKIDDFIGDYVALSVAGSIIQLQSFLVEGKPVKKSTHCGLSKEEMEVPVIVLK